MWRARTTRIGAVLVLVLSAAGCTDDAATDTTTPLTVAPAPDSSTPLGSRVGVVLPPASVLDPAVLAAVEAQLGQLESTTDHGIRRLRGYPTADPRFVEDVTVWLAEQGTELVCVLGDRAEDVAVTLAALYRDIRFCALPAGTPSSEADAEVDDGIARVELRVEELGYLVGVTARTQARGSPVGLVLGDDALPDERFRQGLLAGLAGAEVVEADVSNGQEVSLTDRAEAVLAAEAGVVVIDGGIGASEAVEAIGDRALVMGPDAVLDGAADARVALRWNVRWDLALAGPLRSVIRDPDDPLQTTVGLAEGVFEVVLGDRGSVAAAAALAQAEDGLLGGDLNPREPARRPSSEPDPDPDPADPDPEPADPEAAEPGAASPG